MNTRRTFAALLAVLNLALATALFSACAPSPEADAYGSPDAQAELHVIADDTLKSQANGEGR